jgi:hypothetical protein
MLNKFKGMTYEQINKFLNDNYNIKESDMKKINKRMSVLQNEYIKDMKETYGDDSNG